MKKILNTAVFEEEIQNGRSQSECLTRFLSPTLLKELSGIELRLEFFTAASLSEEMLRIEAFAAEYGLDLLLSIPQPLFANGAVNQKALAAIENMAVYPFSNFKVSCGLLYPLSDADACLLRSFFNDKAYTVSVENPPNEYGTVENVLATLKLLKEQHIKVGYTFDSGNWYWIQKDPVKAYNQLASQITIFHLKSIFAKETILLADPRNQTWKQLISQVPADIPVAFEYNIPPAMIPAEVSLLSADTKRYISLP